MENFYNYKNLPKSSENGLIPFCVDSFSEKKPIVLHKEEAETFEVKTELPRK